MNKIVFTNGCFDIIHSGHVSYLKKAKELGDFLVVGLNSDESVKRLKGEGRPVISEIDRADVLLGLESVDMVIGFKEDDPLRLIKDIRPDVLVKGGDWDVENIIGADFVKKNGGEVYSLPYKEGCSTSDIINRIKKL